MRFSLKSTSKDLLLPAWLAQELGGRITKTNLRTGPLLRRTTKIVATQHGLSWECYVNAASAWLWINNRGLSTALSVNRASPGMGLTERVVDPFARLTHAVFVRRDSADPQEICRRLEPFFEAMALGRFEYFSATPDQVTLWNRRPTIDLLRRRIQLLREQFRDA